MVRRWRSHQQGEAVSLAVVDVQQPLAGSVAAVDESALMQVGTTMAEAMSAGAPKAAGAREAHAESEALDTQTAIG